MLANIPPIVACISIACACIYIYFKLFAQQKARRYTIWAGPCILLLLLAGCGNSSQTSATPPQAHPTPSPTLNQVDPTPGSTSVAQSNDWITYHRDATRTGYVPGERDPQQLTRGWTTNLDGAVYAEPLVVNGAVIVATEGDSLYALDASTGQIKWHDKLGTPQNQAQLPCGDINPLGITSTPVYDPATKLIFAVAEIQGPQHILFGVDAATGQVKIRRDVDPNVSDLKPYQQRSSLVLSQGRVYWGYGGLAGDCGQYIGTIMGIATNGQGPILSYQVPTPREGAVWAPMGIVADSSGNIYASVGNGAVESGTNWDHSDSVLRLSPTLKLEDAFAPQQWAQDNANDADLGSMSPTLLPNGLIFIAGKSGLGYTLHANALGGIGGQIQSTQVCDGQAFGGTANVGTTIIVPCTDGLRQVQVSANGQMTLGWQASSSIHFAPVIGGHTVYSMQTNGTLTALNLDTGSIRATVNIGGTPLPHFDTPTISNGSIFVGTNTGVAEVNIS
jgi:outer membrane protein assembly factor BamB